MSLEEKVEMILRKCIDLEFEKIPNWKEKNFFGCEINLAPRSLVLFYLTLEKEFCVKFRDKDVNNKEFSTFKRVVNLLEEKIDSV